MIGHEDMPAVKAGQYFSRPDGARLRIDAVKNGQVFYVAWRPGEDEGNPIRMIIPDFKIALRKERMSPCDTYRCAGCGGLFFLEETRHGSHMVDTPTGAVECGRTEQVKP